MSTSARALRPADPTSAALMGEHPSMINARQNIERAARMDLSVVVQGETGTGKEIVAQLLHQLSGRAGPFVAVNVAAVPESLAESELFGVMRGGFTGASHDRPGRFEEANRGTLFLDEAAELSIPMQKRLLRVLETGELRRIGGREDRRTDFRLVLSTQEPASDLVAHGRWRMDFMCRVSDLTLFLPRLADRGRDVLVLANHYLALLDRQPLPVGSERVLLGHCWPGNVRELKAAVRRAAFLAAGASPDAAAVVAAARLLVAPVRAALKTDAAQTIRDVTRDHIQAVLTLCDGDATAAAEILGVSRATVYRQRRVKGP